MSWEGFLVFVALAAITAFLMTRVHRWLERRLSHHPEGEPLALVNRGLVSRIKTLEGMVSDLNDTISEISGENAKLKQHVESTDAIWQSDRRTYERLRADLEVAHREMVDLRAAIKSASNSEQTLLYEMASHVEGLLQAMNAKGGPDAS